MTFKPFPTFFDRFPRNISVTMGSTATPDRPLRLAILEADTPVPNANAKYHGYRGVFTDLFRRAVAPDSLETHIAITGYDVVNQPDSYPDLEMIDAVLISGSKHSAYLDDEWILKLVDFTRKALATGGRVKVVGVCFGHQIVGRASGVKVDRNVKGWELAVTEIKLSEKGREIFGTDTLVSAPSTAPWRPAYLWALAKYYPRISTKCTGISSSQTQKAPRTWQRTMYARHRDSSSRARLSQCRGTQSSLATS